MAAVTAGGDDRSAAGGDVGLDALLTDAALGRRRRWLPGRAGAQPALRLATRPRSVARRGAQFAGELGKVAVGRSELEPPSATAVSRTRRGAATPPSAGSSRPTWRPGRRPTG
jgi:hypothetical protein